MNYVNFYSNNVQNKSQTNNKKTEINESQKPKNNKNNEKYLKFALAGLAATGIIAVGIYKLKKGQSFKLSDIKFDKGIASLKKGGENFSGKIKDSLKNGDKIILEYENGIIKNSSRQGSKTIQKVYSYKNGDKIVKIIENGKEQISNISKLSQKGKETAEKTAKEAIEKAAKEASEKAKKEAAEKATEKVAKETAQKTSKEVQFIDLSKDIQENEYKDIFGYTFGDINDFRNIHDFKKEEILDFLEKNKDLTPDDIAKVFGDFKEGKYDIPDKFLIAVNNQLNKTGSSLIVDDVPEMFKGIEPKEIQKAIEKLQLVNDPKKISQFTLKGKNFNLEKIGNGNIGNVYKLSDVNNNSVILKFFKDPFLTGTQGVYAEIPIARQCSLEKVADVPKFFMANPYGKYMDDGSVKGAWQMVEYITPDKKISTQGLKFKEWLKNKGLIFADFNSGSRVGDYIIDVGGVIKPNQQKQAIEDVNLVFSNDVASAMVRGIQKYNENVAQWIEKLKQA